MEIPLTWAPPVAPRSPALAAGIATIAAGLGGRGGPKPGRSSGGAFMVTWMLGVVAR